MTPNTEIFFAAHGAGVPISAIRMADTQYSLMTEECLYGDFCRGLRGYLQAFGALEYLADSNDCDDFAGAAREYARKRHHYSARGTGRQHSGIAVGEFWYRDIDMGRHAIAVAVVRVEGVLALRWLEPQAVVRPDLDPRKILEPLEIRSCDTCVF